MTMNIDEILSGYRTQIDNILGKESYLDTFLKRERIDQAIASGMPVGGVAVPEFRGMGTTSGQPVGAGEALQDLMTFVSHIGQDVPPDWASIYGNRANRQLKEQELMDEREIARTNAVNQAVQQNQQVAAQMAGERVKSIISEGTQEIQSDQIRQSLMNSLMENDVARENNRLELYKQANQGQKDMADIIEKVAEAPEDRHALAMRLKDTVQRGNIDLNTYSYQQKYDLAHQIAESLRTSQAATGSVDMALSGVDSGAPPAGRPFSFSKPAEIYRKEMRTDPATGQQYEVQISSSGKEYPGAGPKPPSLYQQAWLDLSRSNAAIAQVMRDQARQDRLDARSAEAIRKDDKEVEKLSARLEQYSPLVGAFSEAETLIGSPLENIDVDMSTGGVSIGGEQQDLPGVSIPGYGRSTLWQTNAQELEGAIAGIFNIQLKSRSGAAVTIPELERLKKEFNAGRWDNEALMVQGLKRAKAIMMKTINGIHGGFSKDIVMEYYNRIGEQPAGSPAVEVGPVPTIDQPGGNYFNIGR